MSNFLTSIINCRTKIKVRNTVKVIHEEDRFGSRYSKVEKKGLVVRLSMLKPRNLG